jgi:hypothetical protein
VRQARDGWDGPTFVIGADAGRGEDRESPGAGYRIIAAVVVPESRSACTRHADQQPQSSQSAQMNDGVLVLIQMPI